MPTDTRWLVAGTDFSPCSLNAVQFALALCETIQASLAIVHASGRFHPYSADTEQKLDAALAPICGQFPNVRTRRLIIPAGPLEAICNAATQFDAMCIVAGAAGTHADPEMFIGSTTGEFVKNGNAPVLIIPDGCRFVSFSKVLFAVKNPYVASKDILDPFLNLMSYFNPSVELLHVTRDTMPDLSRFPDPYPIASHVGETHTSDSDNIYHSVQSYLGEHHSDLLVVISRLRGFFEGLFAQQTKNAALFHVDIPILVLHGRIRG